jgi:hypothetical protein
MSQLNDTPTSGMDSKVLLHTLAGVFKDESDARIVSLGTWEPSTWKPAPLEDFHAKIKITVGDLRQLVVDLAPKDRPKGEYLGQHQPIPGDLDDGHVHEVVDRLHVVICTIEDHVASHPLVRAVPTLQAKITDAVAQLTEAYQEAGDMGFVRPAHVSPEE